MNHDPHGILQPGNIGAFASVCKTCGCRFPGALGHGPPCGCPDQPDLVGEILGELLDRVRDRKIAQALDLLPSRTINRPSLLDRMSEIANHGVQGTSTPGLESI